MISLYILLPLRLWPSPSVISFALHYMTMHNERSDIDYPQMY